MKKILLGLLALVLVLCPFVAAENVSTDALLAKIQERVQAENVLSADDMGAYMTALRSEYESRKNISLKAYTLEERTRLMLQDGPIADAVKEMAKSQIEVQEQARISLATSIAVAKGANAGEVKNMVRTMARNQVAAGICLRAMEEIGTGKGAAKGVGQVRLMAEEMVKLGYKGDGLVAAIREMNSMMNSGETPREARLAVMEQVKLMVRSGAKEDAVAAMLQIRARERVRLIERVGTPQFKQEMRQEQVQGGGTGGTKSGGEGKKGR
jgi:hypothetical protein